MQTLLNLEVNEAGNLKITATPEGIEYLQDEIQIVANPNDNSETTVWKNRHMAIWYNMLESYSCNGSYTCMPDNFFALTDSSMPIIINAPLCADEDGNNLYLLPSNKLWYFADYAITDEFEKLLAGETITLLQFEVDIPNIENESTLALRKMFNNKDYSKYTEFQLILEWERREQIKNAIVAKTLTTTQQLQFIIKNSPEYSKHEVEKIFKASFCHALSDAIGYTHFSNDCNYLFNKYKVDYTNTVKQEITRFEQFVRNDLKIGLNEFKTFYYCSSLFTSYWFRREGNSPNQFYMDSRGYTNLVHFIQFLTDNTIRENYNTANVFCDEHKIRYFQSDSYQYAIGNITVKRYKNGRIDITGLSDLDQRFIDNMLRITEIWQVKK